MDKIDIVVEMVGNYQQWGEWLSGLNLAAIGSVAFLYGLKEKTARKKLSRTASASLVLFGFSILMSTMLVGNLNSVIVQFYANQSMALDLIKSIEIPGSFPLLSVKSVSALAGFSFTFGAILFAIDTYLQQKQASLTNT